jgi:hypothetical protein
MSSTNSFSSRDDSTLIQIDKIFSIIGPLGIVLFGLLQVVLFALSEGSF